MNLRELERSSIRSFVQAVADENVFAGRDVLDYGCGKQSYRDVIVMGGGRYHGYDDPGFPASTVAEPVGDRALLERKWGAILCTQVIQYQPNPAAFLGLLHNMLHDNGALVITWPTNWPEVEKEDLYRFTHTGMAHLLSHVGFGKVTTAPRAFADMGGDRFYLGHGAVAWT